MDTKVEFEKWCSEKGYSTEQFHYGNWAGKYKLESVRNKWEGWKESRAAIEIELPELAVDHDERLMVETSVEGAFNLGVIRSRQAITSHGIRIKRKTE